MKVVSQQRLGLPLLDPHPVLWETRDETHRTLVPAELLLTGRAPG